MVTQGASSLGLHWTDHPLPDMGIAAILAHAGRGSPEDLTEADLERLATDAERWYFNKALSGYLTVLFTSNLINPSFKDDRKREFVGDLLRSFARRPEPGAAPCVYCGRPSVRQADRTLIPMLSGRNQINFYPEGNPSLGLCGLCLVALQALAIGAPFCEGRAVIVEAEDKEILKAVAGERLALLRQILSLSSDAKPPTIRGPRTRVIDALGRLGQRGTGDDSVGGSVTVYVLSNSGQGPDIAISPLPAMVVRFVARAQRQRYRRAWHDLVRRGWEGKRRNDDEPPEEEKRALRNYFYEGLFTLPREADRFLRRWFAWTLKAITHVDPGDREEKERWPLIGLFLMEVLGMEQSRIDAIRVLADNLATDIEGTRDRPLFRRFFTGRIDYRVARDVLIRANQKRIHRQGSPLITLDDFLLIFEEADELARSDWRLAWDLLRIRLVEELCGLEFFKSDEGKEVMEEVAEAEAEETDDLDGDQIN